jgi:hypothetical protein
VRVEELAQVEFDRQRDFSGDQAADDRQPHAQDRGAEDRQREGEEVGLVAVLDRVDRAADQPWDQHRHAHRRPGEHQRPPQAQPVRTKETHQPAVRTHYHRLYKVKYWANSAYLSCSAALALET